MKAEHRKQLETNTLADHLGKLVKNLKHGVSRNAWAVVGLVVLVLALIYVWREFSVRSQQRSAALWAKWDRLDDPEVLDQAVAELPQIDRERITEFFAGPRIREKLERERLETFAKEHVGTPQGRIALFQAARLALFEGLRDLGRFESRVNARKRLEEAAETYEKLIKESRDLPILHQEALLNCAKANESLGNLKEARDYYTQLQTRYAKNEIGKVAERELKRLDADAAAAADLSKELAKVPAEPKPLNPND